MITVVISQSKFPVLLFLADVHRLQHALLVDHVESRDVTQLHRNTLNLSKLDRETEIG